ncbi:MAG: UDP-N-acetylmuramate dehydrogenase [Pseudomonadota bacterium]
MHVQRNEPLAPLNTLALQSSAQYLIHATSDETVAAAIGFAREHRLPIMPLGSGSNIVFTEDVQCLVLHMATRGIQIIEDTNSSIVLRVAAGENWHELVANAVQKGWYGLENLALIPGTVGAAPIQNIGAYGVELAPLVERVHCLELENGRATHFDRKQCEFAYRDSVFKQSLRDKFVITGVDLRLQREAQVQTDYPALADQLQQKPHEEVTPQQIFEAVVAIRRRKLPDPLDVPNAGSFFKNPVVNANRARELRQEFAALPQYAQSDGDIKLPAAWLIEHCGWKGYRRDGLGVHPEHALVLVNYGSGQGRPLLHLAREIADSVLDVFDIALEIEPRVYGSWSRE